MANQYAQQENALRLTPPVDIYESERDYLLVLDVPGIDGSAIEVELDKEALKISAKRADGVETVQYQREFRLPSDVNGGEITAVAKEGVLRVVLPKHAGAQPKRIAVATN